MKLDLKINKETRYSLFIRISNYHSNITDEIKPERKINKETSKMGAKWIITRCNPPSPFQPFCTLYRGGMASRVADQRTLTGLSKRSVEGGPAFVIGSVILDVRSRPTCNPFGFIPLLFECSF